METQAIQLNPSVMSLEEVKGVLYLTVRGRIPDASQGGQTTEKSASADAAVDPNHLVDTTA